MTPIMLKDQLRVKKEKHKQERGPKIKKMFEEAFDGVDLKLVNMRFLKKSLLRTFRMTTHEPEVEPNPKCYGDIRGFRIDLGDIVGPSGPFGIPFVGPDSGDISVSHESTTDMRGFKLPLFERLYMSEDERKKLEKDYKQLRDYEQKFNRTWGRIQSRCVSFLSFSTIVFHANLTPKKKRLKNHRPQFQRMGQTCTRKDGQDRLQDAGPFQVRKTPRQRIR